jgi:hypothetical protein
MSAGIISGNTASITLMEATVDLGSVAANTSETETATLSGALTTDYVVAIKPSLEAGIVLGSSWISADDTVSIQVINSTGSAVDAASETFQFLVFRPDTPNDMPTTVIS